MGRHRHDCAGTVLHEYEVGDVHGNGLVRRRIRHVGTSEAALLFIVLGAAARFVLVAHLKHELGHLLVTVRALGKLQGERMLGSQTHERHPEKGVRSRGKHIDGFESRHRSLEGKCDSRPAALADPVPLHEQYLIRPLSLEAIEFGEQFLGIVGDFEEPLVQLLLHHLGATTPAGTAFDLFIGEHCLAGRTPVDERTFPVHKPLFVHLDEELLLPLEIIRLARGHLPVPVVGKAHAL